MPLRLVTRLREALFPGSGQDPFLRALSSEFRSVDANLRALWADDPSPPSQEEQDKEIALLLRAIDRARRDRGPTFNVDGAVLDRFRHAFLGGGEFRLHHRVALSEVTADIERAAFQGPRDRFREENAAFCHLMYQGLQKRFLDRYQGERPEDFLDRPRKSSRNLTKLVVDVKSKLYHKAPRREFEEDTDEKIKQALRSVWAFPHFNLSMGQTDRYTRLQGTVSIRPFWDPDLEGKIRLWRFRSDQLRVIPDPERPWEPAVVIEREHPFWDGTVIRIWTKRSFLTLRSDQKIEAELHGLGRVPHTFFRDALPWGSFFVEGIGRSLCDANAVLNGKLTDLNEVYQMQGFGIPFLRGKTKEDEQTISPRTPLDFGEDAEPHHGVFFASPNGTIETLRGEVRSDFESILQEHEVPPAALGIAMGRVPPSGAAVRELMRPLLDDLDERAMLFAPQELDLADSILRVRAEHDVGFEYDPETEKPVFVTHYQNVEFSTDLRDQTARDAFEVATAVSTPAQIIRRKNPEQFKTPESSVVQWKENLKETEGTGVRDSAVQEDSDVDFDAGFAPDDAVVEAFGDETFDDLIGDLIPDALAARARPLNGNGEGG